MDIVGIGTQVMECLRVRKLIDRHGETFLRQVYTDRELLFCNGRSHTTEHFTAIWAAKEAVFRSLGTTWRRGMAWTDIEVICENSHGAQARITGATRELMAARGAGSILLTMAHCRTFATATSIAVKGNGAG
jgi:holo-[acyl-carrier protein] synthase